MRALLAALLLAGCAAPAVQPGAPMPVAPEDLQTCAGRVPAPIPPKPPRSVAALLSYAVQADRARAASEAAREDCAARLNRLNNWILERGR